jgi:uncharacterized protein YprB with RNaseH-like and TPR domain
MLQNTFVHLPGVGVRTELSLWQRGIHSWDSFCGEHGLKLAPFGRSRYEELRSRLDQCRERLCARDPAHFAGALSPRLLWRLFAEFRDCAAYLDIETTGLGGPSDHITTAALYDGRQVFYYVYGDNLDLFARDLGKYRVLITYNGSCFDLPFIRNQFGIALDHVHIDLRYLLSSLGYRGGLKGCERSLGLDRAELNGVDGYFAVLLWYEYSKRGNMKALETLLAYNIADTVNLENLMVQTFNMKLSETPFQELKIPLPCPPALPFKPDAALIDELRHRFYGVF